MLGSSQKPGGFRWDTTIARYRRPDGRFVSRKEVWDTLNYALDVMESETRNMADSYVSGEISVQEFFAYMRRNIKDAHLIAAAMAKGGWDRMNQADYGAVGGRVRWQYGYLQRFMVQCLSGTQPLDGRIAARARMYIQSARITYQRQNEKEQLLAGYKFYLNVLDPDAEHCEECVKITLMGWHPIGSLPEIGTRTCLSNDRCWWAFSMDPPVGFSPTRTERLAGVVASGQEHGKPMNPSMAFTLPERSLMARGWRMSKAQVPLSGEAEMRTFHSGPMDVMFLRGNEAAQWGVPHGSRLVILRPQRFGYTNTENAEDYVRMALYDILRLAHEEGDSPLYLMLSDYPSKWINYTDVAQGFDQFGYAMELVSQTVQGSAPRRALVDMEGILRELGVNSITSRNLLGVGLRTVLDPKNPVWRRHERWEVVAFNLLGDADRQSFLAARNWVWPSDTPAMNAMRIASEHATKAHEELMEAEGFWKYVRQEAEFNEVRREALTGDWEISADWAEKQMPPTLKRVWVRLRAEWVKLREELAPVYQEMNTAYMAGDLKRWADLTSEVFERNQRNEALRAVFVNWDWAQHFQVEFETRGFAWGSFRQGPDSAFLHAVRDEVVSRLKESIYYDAIGPIMSNTPLDYFDVLDITTGAQYPHARSAVPAPVNRLRDAIEFVRAILPEKIVPNPGNVAWLNSGRQRAWYLNRGPNRLSTIEGGTDVSMETLVHELGHHIEYGTDGALTQSVIQEMARIILNQPMLSFGGMQEDSMWVNVVAGEPEYGFDLFPKLVKSYVGKLYGGTHFPTGTDGKAAVRSFLNNLAYTHTTGTKGVIDATEWVSMLLQHIYMNPGVVAVETPQRLYWFFRWITGELL